MTRPDGGPWDAREETIRQFEERRPTLTFREEAVPEYELPPVLTRPMTAEEWPGRRGEIVTLLKDHVFGVFPDGSTSRVIVGEAKAADDLGAIYRPLEVVTSRGEREHRFTAHFFAPADADGPRPVFLLIDNRRSVDDTPQEGPESAGFWPVRDIVSRGYATVAFRNHDVDPDTDDGFRNGVHALFEDRREGERDAWSTIAAWAWGASRVLDALQQTPEADGSWVAVVGHSRGGKTALCAGAYDRRFAMAVSNESGCGGAALSRRRFGETLAVINASFPHWFNARFKTYSGNESAMPVDSHLLLAAMAPRRVYVASAAEDLWADPRGEYEALRQAGAAFELFGDGRLPKEMPAVDTPAATTLRGYHIRTGRHNLTAVDWSAFLDFADRR